MEGNEADRNQLRSVDNWWQLPSFSCVSERNAMIPTRHYQLVQAIKPAIVMQALEVVSQLDNVRFPAMRHCCERSAEAISANCLHLEAGGCFATLAMTPLVRLRRRI